MIRTTSVYYTEGGNPRLAETALLTKAEFICVARQPEPIATGFDSPEGPAFAENGDLYCVNWLTGSINRLDSAGVVREVADRLVTVVNRATA